MFFGRSDKTGRPEFCVVFALMQGHVCFFVLWEHQMAAGVGWLFPAVGQPELFLQITLYLWMFLWVEVNPIDVFYTP